MSVYKEPRVTNAFAGIHSTRNRIFCLPADRTEYGSVIVRSDPVIAAPAILFLAESETVMNRSAARGVDFPFALSWRSHSGACPFGRTGEFPRQYAIRLSKSGGEKYAFTSIGKIIGASEPVLRRSRKISPHPVFHTFLAFDHLKIALFTKSLQFTRGLSCKKRMSVIFGCQRQGCQASFSVALHLIATGKAKVHPLTSTGKKIGVSTTVLKFSSKNFSLHSCSQENRRFDYRFRKVP